MSYDQLFGLALLELRLKHNLDKVTVNRLIKDSTIQNHCQFIYQQLIRKQRLQINSYKDSFNSNPNHINGLIQNDPSCSYITKCCTNGYKVFCNKLANQHQSETHQFQNKNMNHLMDQKYQNDIHILHVFYLDLICMMINQYLEEEGELANK